MGKRGKGFTRSDKDKEPRNSSRVRVDSGGNYWIGSWRFTKISIVLACGLGLLFGFMGFSYISVKFFGGGM